MGPFWGSKDGASDTRYVFYEHILTFNVFADI